MHKSKIVPGVWSGLVWLGCWLANRQASRQVGRLVGYGLVIPSPEFSWNSKWIFAVHGRIHNDKVEDNERWLCCGNGGGAAGGVEEGGRGKCARSRPGE
ncbi:hypothetical protein M0804_004778 [Polistes exclamans]|nr:hypothetical protein M0804_004778 [Polistes exclamans]